MNNKDKNELSKEENIDYTHLHKAEADCKYSKNGLCDECILTENEKCPYVDELNKNS